MQQPEMTLDQMLDDPIVRQLMARDGVAESELRALAASLRPRGAASPAAAVRVGPEPRSFDGDGEF